MNWYKDNFNEWKEIIETVARETGRNEQMVEKDTIQSIFLNELSKSDYFTFFNHLIHNISTSSR